MMDRVTLRNYLMALPLMWVSMAIQANTPELAKLDRLIAQQLQLERAIVDLQTEAQQRDVDNKRLLSLYKQEHEALTQAVARHKQQQDDVAEQRKTLLAAQAGQEQQTIVYQQQLEQGLASLLTQWPALPPPLQLSLQDAWAQLQDAHRGLSDRFAAMIDILTQLDAFNGGINFHQGVLTHEGESWQAEQLFVGLAQGYYRLPDSQGAGVGHVVNGVWQWQSQPKQQGSIDQAFAIYQGRHKIEFVDLPLLGVGEAQP